MPGKIHVPVSFGLDGLDNVTRRLRNMTRTIGAVGAAAASIGAVFAGKFIVNAVEGSRDLERNLEGLRTVFKGSTDQMVEFSEQAYRMGLSLSEAAKASTFIGSVLKQSGFSIEETADLTEELVSLGADLALTYGYDVQEALLGMTALFRGEYDPIEKFGVAMKQSEIDAEKAARGLDGLTGAAERFADQQIRVEFLMERSADALGAVDRQQGNLAVQQNALNASFNTMRDSVALGLLPVLADLTGQMSDGLMRVTPEVTEAFNAFKEPVDSLGQLILDIGEPAILAMADGLETVGGVIGELLDPTTMWGEKVAELFVNLTYLKDQIFAVIDAIVQTLGGWEAIAGAVGFVIDVFDVLVETFQNVIIYLEEWLPNAFHFLMLNMERDMAVFIDAIDPFQIFRREENRQAIADAQAQLDEFTSSINKNVESRIKAKDISKAGTMMMIQEQFAALKLEKALNLLPKTSRLEILQNELKDLKKFKAPQEAIDKVQEEIKKLLGTAGGGDGDGEGDGESVKDFVAEFYAKLADEMGKQSARLELRGIGLSEGLIEDVLNSQGWESVYNAIVNGGQDAADALQEAFNSTEAGLKELEELENARIERQQEINVLLERQADIQADLTTELAAATDTYADFVAETLKVIDSVDALETYRREIGMFESRTRDDLQRIEQQIQAAFDNKYLLADAKENLLDYARAELNTLAQLQRRRDELLAQRNAAADVIFGVAEAVSTTGNLVSLLGNVQDKVTEIQVKEVFEDIVKTAGSLQGFRVTLQRNYTDVITETVDKSKQLTDNFKGVINRTKDFIANLIQLRELGLDPFLFNQLVEAGVEAGGATAQALVEGGSKTVQEINGLQTELNKLGVDLGEETYEVTKNSGVQFVSGLIDGMDSQLEELEEYSMTFSKSFSETFAEIFSTNMEDAFEDVTQAIRDEFRLLLDELQAELDAVQDKHDKALGVGNYFTPPPGTLFPGDPGYGNVRRVGGGVDEILTPEEFTSRYSASPQTMSASTATQSSVTNNITITANNPLDAQEAGKRVVNAIGQYQQNNGDFNVTLTGAGS